MTTVLTLELDGVKKLRSGKVREVFDLGEDLLIVATDRISAFDIVLPNAIPDKGKVLNRLSAWWFTQFEAFMPNHMITADADEYPAALKSSREVLAGRSMLVRKAEPLPVECVVRGYLAGSGWKDYQKTGAVCGIGLPPELVEAARLEDPIFTPSTKATTGHDENIDFARFQELVGCDLAAQMQTASLLLYSQGRAKAARQGIIIADTKFEFGVYDGKLMLIDEALTPDSSRFWSAAEYKPGSSPASFDKQFVRNYLERIGWNKQPPAPELPPDIVEGTSARYREAYRMLTGTELEER